jgi:hypothetical protein
VRPQTSERALMCGPPSPPTQSSHLLISPRLSLFFLPCTPPSRAAGTSFAPFPRASADTARALVRSCPLHGHFPPRFGRCPHQCLLSPPSPSRAPCNRGAGRTGGERGRGTLVTAPGRGKRPEHHTWTLIPPSRPFPPWLRWQFSGRQTQILHTNTAPFTPQPRHVFLAHASHLIPNVPPPTLAVYST